MKSYENFVMTILEHLKIDVLLRWPSLESSLERDFSRLRGAIEDRGLPFFTITLPDAGKLLDKQLDGIVVSPRDYPSGYPLRSSQPLLFKGLRDLIFDDQGIVLENADCEAVFFLRQLHYGFKKLTLDCNSSKIMETLDEFYKIEQELPPSYIGTWDEDCPNWKDRQGHPLLGADLKKLFGSSKEDPYVSDSDLPKFWAGFRLLCNRFTYQLQEPDWYNLIPRHGPGAVSEGTVRKYSFPNWPKKLEQWFPFDWYGESLCEGFAEPDRLEPASRLITVPKSQKGPRLICAEPIAHQYLQQALWRWMERQLDHTILSDTINFRRQDLSRERVLRASHDLEHATIDLSSASDRISTRLVEYVFNRHPILDGLHACRTRYLGQNISNKHPDLIKIKKYATQGTAMTFPVQSIIFSLIALYAILWDRGLDPKRLHMKKLKAIAREVRVYGDDIILPTPQVDTISFLLEECGLKVNTSKSFGGNAFRESCGMDAFKGVDVTPAYLRGPYDGKSPTSLASTVDVSNNLHLAGLWATAKAVVGAIPMAERKLIPCLHVSEDASLYHGKDQQGNLQSVGALRLSSFSGTRFNQKAKWDSDYQREYFPVISIRNVSDRWEHEGIENLIQYFIEKPSPDVIWNSGEVLRSRARKTRGRVYR